MKRSAKDTKPALIDAEWSFSCNSLLINAASVLPNIVRKNRNNEHIKFGILTTTCVGSVIMVLIPVMMMMTVGFLITLLNHYTTLPPSKIIKRGKKGRLNKTIFIFCYIFSYKPNKRTNCILKMCVCDHI